MKKHLFCSTIFVLSFFIVAFGQPDASSLLSVLASGIGFALFWLILFAYPSTKVRFRVSFAWFTAVQAVQMAWLATPEYQGVYIFFVYGLLSMLLGLEFGLLSLLFPKKKRVALSRLFGIAALWTLFEWSRLFILCGFSLNPAGLSMTAFPVSAQLASIFGVFGLSFWVMLANLLFLNFYLQRKKSYGISAAAVFLFPYLFGLLHIQYHDQRRGKNSQTYNVALVQTGLLPDEKYFFYDKKGAFVSPYEQWLAILKYLKEFEGRKIDLIVLPESAVPFSAKPYVYPYEQVNGVLASVWGENARFDDLLISPFALSKDGWRVNNLFWAKTIADQYGAEVVLGLDDTDHHLGKSYNAAFHLMPRQTAIGRYEKRVLLPLAEYLPYSFLRSLAARYGIVDFFSHGKEATVFRGGCPLNVSICYEECFSHLMREGRINGAKLFVNVTNDGWYPSSRLPLKHFFHGKLRAIENGVPLVRACNTGVTAGVDSLGRIVAVFDEEAKIKKGAILVSLDLYAYSTLYTRFGDYLIVTLCILFLIVFALRRRKSA